MNKKQALYASAITVGIATPRAKTHHAEETAKLDAFRESGFDAADYPYWCSIRQFAQNNLAALATQEAQSEINARHAATPALGGTSAAESQIGK